jgi:hypothetical protein
MNFEVNLSTYNISSDTSKVGNIEGPLTPMKLNPYKFNKENPQYTYPNNKKLT